MSLSKYSNNATVRTRHTQSVFVINVCRLCLHLVSVFFFLGVGGWMGSGLCKKDLIMK